MIGKYFIDELDLESFHLTVEKLGMLVFDYLVLDDDDCNFTCHSRGSSA